MKIIPAEPADAAALTKIAFAAKGHWGYPESWMQQWTDALTVTPDYLRRHAVWVAIVEEKPVGFCALQFHDDGALLDHLWVVPEVMGQGVGRALFARAETIAREAGAKRLKIVGDPHAEGFYRRVGAVVYGQTPAPMGGRERFLPLLEKFL